MRPRIENSIGDDAMEDYGFLKFTDEGLKASFLQMLSTMRKNKLFCDVVLNVDNTDIHAHKNVLACVSPHLMELFTVEQENQSVKQSDGIPSYRLNGCITKNALQICVEYAYTGTLEIPDALVQEVYLAAWQLRIENILKECARHLVEELCADSCIEIRSLPGINKNKNFVSSVDEFVSNEFLAVSQTASFLQLQCANIDVLYQTKQEMSVVTNIPLCRLVLDWIKRQLTDETLTMHLLLERTHLLYLALDNSLQDCSDLPAGHESETELVQDYKKLVLKCPNNKGRRKNLATPVRPRVIIYSRDIREREVSVEPDWNIIGSANVGENTFIALATLNGQLTRISIQLRLNNPTTPSPIHCPETLSLCSQSIDKQTDEPEMFCEVAPMSGPKCSLGVADWNGKLFVCGGYDRGDCLKLVEVYNPDTNEWIQEANMIEARGRVQIAVLNGDVYAVGGSNGTTELDTVECFTKDTNKWRKCCKIPMARSNAGVCTLNEQIYCVGGWNGQIGIKQCEVYDCAENKWTSIAPLHTGRYQSGVAAYTNKVWVVGGIDTWNCLASTETYDPEINQWSLGPQLLTARRGCGLAVFNGKLYAIGGSDGTHSLCSTEIFDEESKTWIVGPNLTTPRANVSCVTVDGKLYAVGGFSGKFFLNTIEYLDVKTNEWTTFAQQSGDGDGDGQTTTNVNDDEQMLEQKMTLANGNGLHKSNGFETNGCQKVNENRIVNGHSSSHSSSNSSMNGSISDEKIHEKLATIMEQKETLHGHNTNGSNS